MSEDLEKPTTIDRAPLADKIKNLLSKSEKTTQATPLQRQQEKNLESNRTLKERYANGFILVMIGQLVAMNAVVIATGAGWLTFEEWVLGLYLAGTLAEVFGIVLVITKNLFPQKK